MSYLRGAIRVSVPSLSSWSSKESRPTITQMSPLCSFTKCHAGNFTITRAWSTSAKRTLDNVHASHRRGEPVHLLEARTALSSVKHLGDNLGVVLVLSKGRCAFFPLLCLLQRIGADALASNVVCNPGSGNRQGGGMRRPDPHAMVRWPKAVEVTRCGNGVRHPGPPKDGPRWRRSVRLQSANEMQSIHQLRMLSFWHSRGEPSVP